MGILFNTNTWREPLLMIDSWPPQRGEMPAQQAKPPVSKRFARIGWLERSKPARHDTPAPSEGRTGAHLAAAHTSLPVHQVGNDEPSSTDSRIVIAGCIRDVCAELDRLVDLEQKQRTPSA